MNRNCFCSALARLKFTSVSPDTHCSSQHPSMLPPWPPFPCCCHLAVLWCQAHVPCPCSATSAALGAPGSLGLWPLYLPLQPHLSSHYQTAAFTDHHPEDPNCRESNTKKHKQLHKLTRLNDQVFLSTVSEFRVVSISSLSNNDFRHSTKHCLGCHTLITNTTRIIITTDAINMDNKTYQFLYVSFPALQCCSQHPKLIPSIKFSFWHRLGLKSSSLLLLFT